MLMQYPGLDSCIVMWLNSDLLPWTGRWLLHVLFWAIIWAGYIIVKLYISQHYSQSHQSHGSWPFHDFAWYNSWNSHKLVNGASSWNDPWRSFQLPAECLPVALWIALSVLSNLKSYIVTHPRVTNDDIPSNFWKPIKCTVKVKFLLLPNQRGGSYGSGRFRGCPWCTPLTAQNFLSFMQFFLQNHMLVPLLVGLAPLL